MFKLHEVVSHQVSIRREGASTCGVRMSRNPSFLLQKVFLEMSTTIFINPEGQIERQKGRIRADYVSKTD